LSRQRFVLLRGLLLVGAAALLLPARGAAPLERAEIYFVDAARAMVERGDWLVPYYRGEPFFDKPALTYWLIALCFELFGFTLEAARLVPALAALATILATLWLGERLLDRQRALLGGLVLATTLAFLGFGRMAMSDMLLALWSTLALGLGAALFGPSPPAWALPALGAALGLGFLTKGPVALLLPGVGLALLAAREPGRLASLRARSWIAAAALFAACGLSWFAGLYFRLGPAPLEWFFLSENLARFAGETYDSGRDPWYYLGVYLAEGLPWSPLLPLIALQAWQRRAEPEHAPLRLLLSWLALMALPLSLSRGKIDYYLLPLYPVASLAIAHGLRELWTPGMRALARLLLVCASAALALLPLGLARLHEDWLPEAAVRRGLSVLATLGALALLAAAARASKAAAIAGLAGVSAAALATAAILLVPAFRAAQPNRAVLDDIARERSFRPEARLVYCDDPIRVSRDLLFEARQVAIERCDLWNPASSRFPFLLLLREAERGPLMAVPSLRHAGSYRYLPATTLTLPGLLRRLYPDRLALLANYPTPDPEGDRRSRKDRRRAVRALEEAEERERAAERARVP
jgi:4-amino-4-deoxy-L-arabinose transferase-like glycosyltransferase